MTDRSGFTDYVEKHSDRLLRTAYLLTRDWVVAEDLLQTALAKAWVVWHRVSDDPTPYIHRILTNTHASWWRRRWRGEVPTERLPETGQPDRSDAIDDREALWQALSRLSRRQQAVIVLHYFEGLPIDQVADILDCSNSTVKTQLGRALARLRVNPSLRELKGAL
ncbi:RNA polymerase sigma-70 factor (sigma-E family) [Actinomadura pelletieri DSM 43383]|uniref:RNA polymerase sigma-70 factor (Sigma-E family) n=1 Tax=Actinomadura pelletieri DSM 43383 TaxID=1120940 RepID=A0A495QXX5_9ACTN|nr:SigE family RNA polymerase sigma factor [Actinomadura pelletieri]RKS79045.1 RNA polymerase sigma-70 factor (sigma-E family) [Actinomadura pelletieri DSM 43383]